MVEKARIPRLWQAEVGERGAKWESAGGSGRVLVKWQRAG